MHDRAASDGTVLDATSANASNASSMLTRRSVPSRRAALRCGRPGFIRWSRGANDASRTADQGHEVGPTLGQPLPGSFNFRLGNVVGRDFEQQGPVQRGGELHGKDV